MEREQTAFDWDKTVSKNVRSSDMQDLGKIAEMDTVSFISKMQIEDTGYQNHV